MKAKEYLLKHGKIEAITRGRISRENHAFLKAAVESGAKIDGYSPVESTKPNGEKVIKNTVSSDTAVLDLPAEIFPISSYSVYEYDNGKKITRSLKEICQGCYKAGAGTRSLVYCICGAPEIIRRDARGYVRVYIEGA